MDEVIAEEESVATSYKNQAIDEDDRDSQASSEN